jgi:hypothetical protein
VVSIKVAGEDTMEENEGISLSRSTRTADENGKCTEFREWWNTRTARARLPA